MPPAGVGDPQSCDNARAARREGSMAEALIAYAKSTAILLNQLESNVILSASRISNLIDLSTATKISARMSVLLAIRDNCVPESFIAALRRGIRGFQKLTAARQARLAYLVWTADSKRRAHRVLPGHMSIGYEELARLFGRGMFQ